MRKKGWTAHWDCGLAERRLTAQHNNQAGRRFKQLSSENNKARSSGWLEMRRREAVKIFDGESVQETRQRWLRDEKGAASPFSGPPQPWPRPNRQLALGAGLGQLCHRGRHRGRGHSVVPGTSPSGHWKQCEASQRRPRDWQLGAQERRAKPVLCQMALFPSFWLVRT